MLLPFLSKLGLLFNQPYLIAPLALGGLFTAERRAYSQAILLVTFTMIYNTYLKSIWQMPLPPPLKGWAFPSGHMHSAVVFWGFLAYHYHQPWLSLAVSGMLILSGFGLVYSGYHYLMDVVAAVGFGMLTLKCHALLQKSPDFQARPSREGLLLGFLGIGFTAIIPSVARRAHVWQALATIIGYTVSWLSYEQYQRYQAQAPEKLSPSSSPLTGDKKGFKERALSTGLPTAIEPPKAILNHYPLMKEKNLCPHPSMVNIQIIKTKKAGVS